MNMGTMREIVLYKMSCANEYRVVKVERSLWKESAGLKLCSFALLRFSQSAAVAGVVEILVYHR